MNQINLVQKNWIKINDDLHSTYNTNSQIKFITSMLHQFYAIIVMYKLLVKEL